MELNSSIIIRFEIFLFAVLSFTFPVKDGNLGVAQLFLDPHHLKTQRTQTFKNTVTLNELKHWGGGGGGSREMDKLGLYMEIRTRKLFIKNKNKILPLEIGDTNFNPFIK